MRLVSAAETRDHAALKGVVNARPEGTFALSAKIFQLSDHLAATLFDGHLADQAEPQYFRRILGGPPFEFSVALLCDIRRESLRRTKF
jgi:hypothetical protein